MNNPDDLGFDLFAMKLNYNEALSAVAASGLNNGNISSMIWANKNTDGTNYKAAYGFEYDGANRLINAVYGDGTSLASNINAYNTNYNYDKNGNIDYLKRSAGGTLIDDLSYTYLGNQLTGVSDAQGNKNLGDFSSLTATYTYDANGNMTYNTGKQLSFSYNSLNLPQITDNGVKGKMQFIYNAAGQKLRTTLFDSPANITDTTDYVSNFIYKNGQLSYILMPEGRILVNGNTFDYEYHLKDHLGNTRATYIAGANGTSTINQTTAYYPFGLPINALSSNLENNPYLYNGKELHNELNMDLLDYGARFYDAQVGRWWSVDPMAEMRLNLSPYNYVQNNLIYLIDPNGMYDEAADIGGFWKRDPDEVTGQTTINSNGETEVYIGTINVFASAKNGMLSHEQIENFFNSGIFNGSGGPRDPLTKPALSQGGGVPDWVVNTNSGAGILSGIFGGNYGLTADQTFKYAQRINGKVRTPQVISRALRMNSLKIARGLGRVNIVTGVIGTAYSANQVMTDYQAGGWVQVNGLDVSDAAVGAAGVGASVGVAIGIFSNPVGWFVGIGTGLYFGGRLIYDLTTEP